MTTESSQYEEDLQLCRICGSPRDSHGDRIHPFTPPGVPVDQTFLRPRQQQAGQSNLPFDPVLRQALLDRGILTPADIREAEVKVQMIVSGKITAGGVGDGEQGSAPR